MFALEYEALNEKYIRIYSITENVALNKQSCQKFGVVRVA